MASRLKHLLRAQDNKCFWCRRTIGLPRKAVVISRTNYETVFLYDGEVETAGNPNLDHLIPRWLLGSDTSDNLVASCVECNTDRGNLHEPHCPDLTGLLEWVKRKGHFVRPNEPRLRATLAEFIDFKFGPKS